ncbi:MAG TPA: SLC13 family permease [Thermoanaerobaculia bacterium]|nr:SLC13 family permease [Thermoanaerobaculia bacterium]
MTTGIALMLALIVLAFVAFALELLPLEVVALSLLGAVYAFGLVSAEQALEGFSNKAVIAIGSLLVLSHALTKTGLVEAAAERIESWAMRRRWLGVSVLLGVVAVLSGFLNNTAIVAIFIPLALDLSRRLEISPSRVLMPLSFASIFGGTLTLIGTSTNLLVSSIAQEAGEPPFSMFEFSLLGLVFLGVGLTYVTLFARRLLPARIDAHALEERYDLGAYLSELSVTAESELVGETLSSARLGERFGVNVLDVLRGEQRFERIAGLPLLPGDRLVAQGAAEDILRLRHELGLDAPEPTGGESEVVAEELADDRVLAEALVHPNSALVGRTLADVGFRQRYRAVVLGIRRYGEPIQRRLGQTLLRAWDALLLVVPKNRLAPLERSADLIVLAQHTEPPERPRGWWLVLVVLPLVIALSAFHVVEIAIGALLGAVVLLVTRTIEARDAYRAVDWSVIFLIAAFVPVGQAVINTGTADFVASGILAVARMAPVTEAIAVLSLLYVCTSLLTQMVSNAAAAIVLTPIALSLAQALGVDPRPYLVAVCFAASAEFMTPMGYQTNMMVYAPGGYRFLDYTRFGAPLNLTFWILATLLIPRFWPL